MTLLVVSPDYASHLLPLAALARPWADAGERVVVATGPATDHLVTAAGYERRDLRLGRGSNPGVMRAEQQVAEEDAALRAFFAATRRGMVETLQFQADARGTDLLWQPVVNARETIRIVEEVRPDHVLADHLAFSARLGLAAAGVPYGDVVLGHPTALPVGDEVYGHPTAWPSAFRPDGAALGRLHARCVQVREEFTDRWNAAVRELGGTDQAGDAFAAHGDVVLLNYPEALHDPARTSMLPSGHAFLGSAGRDEPVPEDLRRWLGRDPGTPLVYVSLGSFLSARGDVLARVAEALRPLPLRVVLATGSTDPATLGPVPPSWLVCEYAPQVVVLGHAAVAITHGGNNSVTEALACGVPMVVLPLSTDQFAGAAAVEAAGLGEALDPNSATPQRLRAAVRAVLGGGARAAALRLAADLAARPGAEIARVAAPRV